MLLGDARSGKLSDNITGFGRMLRRAGLQVDASRISLAIESAQCVGLSRKDDFAAALQSVLVSRQQDLEVFQQLFAAYFKDPELTKQLLMQMLPKAPAKAPAVPRKARVQEALAAVSKSKENKTPKEDEVKFDAAMSASQRQSLQHADFQSLRGQRIDWPRTLRMASRHGGEVLNLLRLQRRPQALPLLILVDISGSMERYARLLLAFLHQATRQTPRRVYAFGTGLTDLNAAFKLRDSDLMLQAANQQIADFAGGTRLGYSLAQLRQSHS
ncbi:MAG: VWA domain-containing protein, partial [Rhodoferax sp.]|nr:VWA domain-containing protein [Rhodoferax sp.]